MPQLCCKALVHVIQWKPKISKPVTGIFTNNKQSLSYFFHSRYGLITVLLLPFKHTNHIEKRYATEIMSNRKNQQNDTPLSNIHSVHAAWKWKQTTPNEGTDKLPRNAAIFWQSSSPSDIMMILTPKLANSCAKAFPMPCVLPVTTFQAKMHQK